MADFGSLAPDYGPMVDAPPQGPEDATVRLLRMMRARQMQQQPDPMMAGPGNANPQTAVPGALARMFAPDMTSLMAGEPDPRQFSNTPLPEQGKVLPTDDPRNAGAIREALMLAGSSMPAGRAAMGVEGAGRLIPEMMQSAPGMLPAAGKAVAGASLASILHGEAGAGDEFKWTDPNQDRTKEISAVEKRINDRAQKINQYTDQVTNLGTTKTPSPKGTQDKAIDNLKNSLAALTAQNAEDAPDVKRLKALRGEQETAQNDAFEQFKKQRWAETSLFDVVPGTRQAITIGSPIASYLGGKYLGNRLPLAGALPAAAVKGGAEGFAGQYYPNEMDIGLPDTSPAYKRAITNATDPGYWTRVALATGGGAMAGMLGAGTSAAARRPVIPMLPQSGSGPAGNTATPPQTPAAPAAAGNTPAAPPTPPMTPPAASAPGAPVDLPAFASALERRGQIQSGGKSYQQTSNNQWQVYNPDTKRWQFSSKPPEAEALGVGTPDNIAQTLRYWQGLAPGERAARMQQALKDRPELRSILGDIGK